MEILIVTIIVLLIFITAFVFSNTGMGGGLLYVPILIFLGEMSYSEARPISLCFAFATTGLSAYNHARKGLVDYRVGGIAVSGTLTGTILGFFFISNVDDRIPGLMFSVFIFFVCIKMIYDLKKAGTPQPFRSLGSKRYVLTASVTLASGFLSISLGIGGGLLLVPLFIYINGLETRRASGTSSFTAMFTTLSGIVILLMGETSFSINIGEVVLLTVWVALGSFLGSRWGIKKLKTREVTLIIIGVMILSSLLMLWKYLG